MSKKLEEFQVGAKWVTGKKLITEELINQFTELTGDTNHLHTKNIVMDHNNARMSKIAHGLLTQSVALGLISKYKLYDDITIAMTDNEAHYYKYVFPDDELHCVLEVKEALGNFVSFDCDIKNQARELVAKMSYVLMLKLKNEA